MNTHYERKEQRAVIVFRVMVYLLAVLLVFLSFSILCRENAVAVEPNGKPGVTDLRGFDFENHTAKIAVGWESVYIYPGAFYTSGDFAAGRVTQEGSLRSPYGDFGTMRMVLLLPPGEVYAIAAKSISYAQRIYVDGKEVGAVGVPAQTIESVVPANQRYVVGFFAQEEATEIIFHYSGFIHADGGGLYPMLIGSVANVTRSEQLKTLFEGVLSAALFTALLFFFGMFLFFPGRRYMLWFSLLCGSIALQLLGANNNALMLLLPDVNFSLYLRLSYIITCCIGLTSALYINDLFPGTANKWAIRGFILYCTAVVFFLCFTPTTFFTRYPMELSGSYAAFLGYQLLMILIAAVRGKLRSAMTKSEGFLLLTGMAVYIAFSAIAVYAHQRSWQFFGWEYQAVGIMVFMFLNVLALTLVFARTERDGVAAKEAEARLAVENAALDKMNRLKSEVMQTISHEARTPLAVLGSYAGLVSMELRDKGVEAQTAADLDKIVLESQRIADLIDALKLAAFSGEGKPSPERIPLDLGMLAKQVTQLYRPILERQGVAMTLDIEENLPQVMGSPNALSQVLFNLLQNAKNHTTEGQVSISAAAKDGYVMVTIADTGSGIPAELLPHVLERGVHGGSGSGLGLFIVNEAVKAHGGHIAIKSAPGQGTAVAASIPAMREATDYGA